MDVPKLGADTNPGIQLVSDELPYIPNPNQLIELEDPVRLTTFICPFKNDYFMYWGSVRTNACKHILLWILCRQPYLVNNDQLDTFRSLFTSGHQPIMNNARLTYSKGYEVFHVNPSTYIEDVLYKRITNNVYRKIVTLEKIKEKQRQSKSSTKSVASKNSLSSVDTVTRNPYSKYQIKGKSDITPNFAGDRGSTTKRHSNVNFKGLDKKDSESTVVISMKDKGKRQSHYQELFSVANKLEKNKNELKFDKAGEGDISSINNAKDNEMVTNYLVKESKGSHRQKNKDKGMLKNITQHYKEARMKVKTNKLLSNADQAAEEMSVNSLKYINQQKSKEMFNESDDTYTVNSFNQFKDHSRETINTNYECTESPQNNNIQEKDAMSNSNTNPGVVTTNVLACVVSNENIQYSPGDGLLDKQIDHDIKVVQDIGINTITLDELMTSLKRHCDQNEFKAIDPNSDGTAHSGGSGDECTLPEKSSILKSNFKQKSNLLNKQEMAAKFKLKSQYSHMYSQKGTREDMMHPLIKTETTVMATPRTSKVKIQKGRTEPTIQKRKSEIVEQTVKRFTRSASPSISCSSNHSNSSEGSADHDEQHNKNIKTCKSLKEIQKTQVSENQTRQGEIKVLSADQTLSTSSKKNPNFYLSPNNSKKSKSSISCRGENSGKILSDSTNKDRKSIKSQPSSIGGQCTKGTDTKAFKTKIPSMTDRSKSNLSYRSSLKQTKIKTRPLTPSLTPRKPTTPNKIDNKLPFRLSGPVKSIRTNERNSASKPMSAEHVDRLVKQNINTKTNEPSKLPLPFRREIMSKRQNSTPNAKSSNVIKNEWHSSQKRPLTPNSSKSVKLNNINRITQDTEITEPIELRTDIVSFEGETSEMFTRMDSEVLIVSRKSSDKESCDTNLDLEKRTNDSTEALHKQEYKINQTEKQSKINKFHFQRPLSRNKTVMADGSTEDAHSSDTKELPTSDTMTNTNVTVNVDTNLNYNASNKPISNKTRVFNKNPIKIQKPTPVHTWRY